MEEARPHQAEFNRFGNARIDEMSIEMFISKTHRRRHEHLRADKQASDSLRDTSLNS